MRTLLVVLILSIAMLAQSVPPSQTPAPQAPAGHGIIGNPEKFADAHLAAVDRAVTLTEAQKPRLRGVFLDEAKKLGIILGDSALTDQERGRKVQSLHFATIHRVAAELTAEQREKFFNFMPEARPRPGVVQN